MKCLMILENPLRLLLIESRNKDKNERKAAFMQCQRKKTMNMIFVTLRDAYVEFSNATSRESVQVWLQFCGRLPNE